MKNIFETARPLKSKLVRDILSSKSRSQLVAGVHSESKSIKVNFKGEEIEFIPTRL